MPLSISVFGLVAVLAGLGLLVGTLMARVSVRLAGEGRAIAPNPLRLILVSGVAVAVGGWAVLAVPSMSMVLIAVTALLGWQLLLIALIDAEHLWLPDGLTGPLVATGLVANALLMRGIPWPQLIGAVAGFGLLWSLGVIYRRLRGRDGLGGGDPFLMAGAGAWVGWIGLPSVLIWACAGGLMLVVIWRFRRRVLRGTDRLPFGTFLALGVWLTWIGVTLGR